MRAHAIGAVVALSGLLMTQGGGEPDCLTPAAITGTTTTITGNGTSVSEPFRLDAGTTLFTVETHPGPNDYVTIDVLPAPGSIHTYSYAIGIAGIGEPVDETEARRVFDAGEYILAVDGDGDWSVTIAQ